MSWPPYSSGARMHTSDAPPTRKSISALGDVNPAGPHHRVTYAGFLQAFHTSSTGASKMRLTTTSNVWAWSFVSSLCTVANPFLSALLAGEHPTGDIDERTRYGAGLLRGQERRRGRNFGQLRRAARHPHLVQALDQALEGSLVLELAVHRGELLSRKRLGESGSPDAHYANALWPDLRRQVAEEGVGSRVGGTCAAHHGASVCGAGIKREDNTRSLLDHATRCRPRRDEVAAEPLTTARKRSSVVMSISGIPCTSPRVMRLKDTSMLPACETTAWACSSTACSSRASSTATSAAPPSALMSLATASRFSRVRPTRKTRAPSRENSLATAPPMDPPPP